VMNDMTGKHVMITGCTAGLGRAAAIEIARMGASVALVCRSREKGELLADEIAAQGDPDRVSLFVGDLGCQKDIREIADAYLSSDRPLHVLFNNAGVIMQKRALTPDGFEMTFGVNHLGYFLLTLLLLERLDRSAPARIVNTASDAYRFAGSPLDFDDLQGERNFSFTKAYGASKLANILFTQELARRLEGRDVSVNAFHPGMVASDFAKNNGGLARFAMKAIKPFARTPLKGAETGIHLCTAPEVAGQTGGFYYNRAPRALRKASFREGDGERLWALSEEYVSQGFPL
jgi:NAD(P)-dependent dehydrogenase (short-subunit alcohol dehydrogenase family)